MENRVVAWDAYKKDDDELRNMQGVEEKLLRMSVKLTESFATDILILLRYLKNYFDTGIDQVNIFFQQNGVSWQVLKKGIVIRKVGKEPGLYRGKAMLLLEGRDVSLTWEHGNC